MCLEKTKIAFYRRPFGCLKVKWDGWFVCWTWLLLPSVFSDLGLCDLEKKEALLKGTSGSHARTNAQRDARTRPFLQIRLQNDSWLAFPNLEERYETSWPLLLWPPAAVETNYREGNCAADTGFLVCSARHHFPVSDLCTQINKYIKNTSLCFCFCFVPDSDPGIPFTSIKIKTNRSHSSRSG